MSRARRSTAAVRALRRRRRAAVRALRRRARRLRARSRLRAANVRRTGAARSRTPPSAARPAPAPPPVETSYGAPRTLLYVRVQRDNPSWRDLYGHWWVEVGEQSWGWWPRAVPLGLRQVLFGSDGVLNGVGLLGRAGTWERDAAHGLTAAHSFHPVLGEPISDDEVRARLQAYAQAYRGRWRWSWSSRTAHETCRSFQDGLLAAAGLSEGRDQLASRGSGCPFLYRPRTLLWWFQDRLERRQRSGDVQPHQTTSAANPTRSA